MMSNENYCGTPRGVYHCPSCRALTGLNAENAQLRALLAAWRAWGLEWDEESHAMCPPTDLVVSTQMALADLPDAPVKEKP